MSTNFTDKQMRFLDVLYEDAKGDVAVAKEMAGYARSTPLNSIISPLADEIVKRGQHYMAVHVPKAAMGMVNIVDDPNQLGVANRISAAKEIMDRAGLVKRDKVDISTEGVSGIFLLPAKNKE